MNWALPWLVTGSCRSERAAQFQPKSAISFEDHVLLIRRVACVILERAQSRETGAAPHTPLSREAAKCEPTQDVIVRLRHQALKATQIYQHPDSDAIINERRPG